MSQGELTEDLKAMLSDAAEKFSSPGDEDFYRHLAVAAMDMGRFRPRTLVGSLTLAADQSAYPAPADLLSPKYPRWGIEQRARSLPWDKSWPGRLPRLSVAESGGVRVLMLDPPPTNAQIEALGSSYSFYYFAGHVIATDANGTTVMAGDRPLLLIRAAAQAMIELANRNVTKPVQLGGGAGVGSMPKNGTPAALGKDLMELFEKMAA